MLLLIFLDGIHKPKSRLNANIQRTLVNIKECVVMICTGTKGVVLNADKRKDRWILVWNKSQRIPWRSKVHNAP